MKPELSILIPTKDRYNCLIPVIKDLESDFKDYNIEIVVQDNTLNNEEFVRFLNCNEVKFVKYFHVESEISMSENCNLSVKNSTGEYSILIGDDDYVFPTILNCIKWMKENNIEVLNNSFSVYQWNGVETKTILRYIPGETYILQKGLKKTYNILETKSVLKKIIRTGGGMGPQDLPRLYHGVVKKSVLQKVYDTCGTYFPGPSPDMAVATALACHLERHAHFNSVFSVAGASKTSNTGLSTVKKNVGKLEDIKFLDRDYIQQWDSRIPKVWAVSTIWPQSMIQSLKDCKQSSENINLAYYYALLLAFSYFFSPQIVKKITRQKIKEKGSIIFVLKVGFYYCSVWLSRIYKLLFVTHYKYPMVHSIAETYKITEEKYK